MTNCECPIDLNRLSSSSDAVKYDRLKFNGAIWKDPELGGCCLVFGNGKIIVNGKASDERIAEERLRNYVQLLRQYGWSNHVYKKEVTLLILMSGTERSTCIEQIVPYVTRTFPGGM